MFECHCILAMTDSQRTGSVVQETHTELGEGEGEVEGEKPESEHVSEPPGRSLCAPGQIQEVHTFCKKCTSEYTHLHHQCDITQSKSSDVFRQHVTQSSGLDNFCTIFKLL